MGGGFTVLLPPSPKEDGTVQYMTLVINSKELNMGGFIVDSGTTATILTKKLYKPFQIAWKAATGHDWNTTAREIPSEQDWNTYPTILFQLTGLDTSDGTGSSAAQDATTTTTTASANAKSKVASIAFANTIDPRHPNDVLIAMPPQRYMMPKKQLQANADSKTTTSRLYEPTKIKFTNPNGSILGANFIMGHNVHFDSSNNRIGFAESDCNYAAVTGIHTPSSEDGDN